MAYPSTKQLAVAFGVAFVAACIYERGAANLARKNHNALLAAGFAPAAPAARGPSATSVMKVFIATFAIVCVLTRFGTPPAIRAPRPPPQMVGGAGAATAGGSGGSLDIAELMKYIDVNDPAF